MTDDLVKRLRRYAKDQGGWNIIDETCEEAADYIEQLESELRFQKVLSDERACYVCIEKEEKSDARIVKLEDALIRAERILRNMAKENDSFFIRWPIHHEPLRADAKNVLPEIHAALDGEK